MFRSGHKASTLRKRDAHVAILVLSLSFWTIFGAYLFSHYSQSFGESLSSRLDASAISITGYGGIDGVARSSTSTSPSTSTVPYFQYPHLPGAVRNDLNFGQPNENQGSNPSGSGGATQGAVSDPNSPVDSISEVTYSVGIADAIIVIVFLGAILAVFADSTNAGQPEEKEQDKPRPLLEENTVDM